MTAKARSVPHIETSELSEQDSWRAGLVLTALPDFRYCSPTMQRSAQFPADLAKHVAARLAAVGGIAPAEAVLVRLLETLYFASLKTDEGRPPLCTVNFFAAREREDSSDLGRPADHWSVAPLDPPVPLDVRHLTKLARAVDPAFSSLAVSCDDAGELWISGLVDQELHFSDFIALDAAAAPRRPGLFQVSISGVGNLSVYRNFALVGRLEQNTLVQECHDVLWFGPVHALLEEHFHRLLTERGFPEGPGAAEYNPRHSGMLVRWLNALCRVLMNIQQYKHGGGLLITPEGDADGLNVKHRIAYGRLADAVLGVDQYEFFRNRVAAEIAELTKGRSRETLPAGLHYRQRKFRKRFDQHRNEELGCTHFIASLSCVDGFVLCDRRLQVRGFGVEVRSGAAVENLVIAGDPLATPHRLRKGRLEQYGTRHRAMIRYCYEHPGSLGFVVSQDGDIRAMLRVGEQLVLWENIEVQLAFRLENGAMTRYDWGSGERAA